MLKIPMAMILLFTGSIAFAQQVTKVSPNGTKYFLYTPPGYSQGSGPYPLLVVLHGQGGMGDDINLLLIHKDEIPAKLIAQNNWPSQYPFIVVTPQLKRDESIPDPREQVWPPDVVDEVIQTVRSDYAVNQNKIYLTGLSLGAHGSYSYAAAYPGKVAGVVMISGAQDSTIACQVKDIPIWAFHGSDDGLVFPVFSTGMVRSINACSPRGKFRPQLNMLYARRHEGWTEIYNNSSGYNIYDWLLKFTKNDPANTPPYVNAGKDMTIVDREEALHLHGEFFDSDGTITNVLWTKVSGPGVTLEGVSSKLLKLSNLTPGNYEFELRVTDDDGSQGSDRVQINIVSSLGSSPAVTGMTLMNSENQQDIADLTDGYAINPQTLNEINIRASAAGNPGSIRFKINGDHNSRTIDNAPYLLASPRWTVEEGEYLVCATAFAGKKGTGTAGISQCFKIVVSTHATPPPPPPPPPEEEVKHFYAKGGTDISLLSSWSSNAEGTGTSPASFSGNDLTFDVQKNVVINYPLAIGGTGSVFRIRSGGDLALNSQLTATIDIEAQAVLQVNSGHPVTFGTLSPLSVIHFNTGATAVPMAHYGHLMLKGNGSVKTLAPGKIMVAGNLTIEEGVKVEGAENPPSVLALSGDLHLQVTGSFIPARLFSIAFEKGSGQQFNARPSRAAFQEIAISANTTVEVNASPSKTILELGSATGGGLIVHAGAKFLLKKNGLFITGKGTLNRDNQTGQIGFNGSSLNITSAGADSHLYCLERSDSLDNLVVNLTGTGTLSLHRTLYIADYAHAINGMTNSNGFLSLVSTAGRTGRLLQTDGNGKIAGDVVFQRFIPKGKQTRYISLPLAGVTVSDIQAFIPVTGSFNGASTGAGLSASPSLFYFDETRVSWIAFPESNNTETLATGKGYSILMMDATRDTKLILSGPVNQGDFVYSLTPNPTNDPAKGWNLIGNPYASPVQWDLDGWDRQGTGTSAYVLDDRYPGGRFLVWDGDLGDEEFAGLIAQGQGFFIRTTGDSPTLKIKERAKADTSANLSRQKRTEGHADNLVVTLKQNDLIDRTYIKFSDQGGNHFEDTDAVKRRNGYFSLSTLSSDSISLAINHLKESFCDRSFALLLETAKPGKYILSFRGSRLGDPGSEISLVDNFTSSTVRLHQDFQYEFQVTTEASSFGKNRFQIQMPSGTLADPVIAVNGNLLTSNVESGNQWLLNGEEIEGATEASYSPAIPGEYSLRVTADGCSRLSETVSITVTVTGIHESKNREVTFYPNPASEFIRVHLLAAAPGRHYYYSITNAAGMRVAQGEVESGVLMKGSEFTVRDLASGVYFFRLLSNGWQYHAKFIIDGH